MRVAFDIKSAGEREDYNTAASRRRLPYGEDTRLRKLVEHLREDNAELRQEIDLLRRENRELRAGREAAPSGGAPLSGEARET